MENKFIRIRTTKDIVLFISLIIIGFVLIVSTNNDAANLGGYTLILLGVIFALFYKSAYKHISSKEIYIKKDLSFRGEMKASLLSALTSTPKSINLSEEGKGQTLILRMHYSKTAGKVFLQLFEYIPHQYEPCSDTYEFALNDAKNLIK